MNNHPHHVPIAHPVASADIGRMDPKIKLILVTALVYGLPILLLSVLPFSKKLYGGFDSLIVNLIFNDSAAFSSLGIISDMLFLYCSYLFLFGKEIKIEEKRAYLIYKGARKILSYIFVDNLRKPLELSRDERTSLLFFCVKIFFTPIMLKFMIGNGTAFFSLISRFSYEKHVLALTKELVFSYYFPFIFKLLLAIDTFIYSFGYIFESPRLKNVVRSVEPTAFGWAVAIICYPPINDVTGKILGWYSADFSRFGSIDLSIFFGAIGILLFVIYVWASVALGAKASNLTNRGIVSSGPYRYVRHPSYMSKNLAWWVMGIPLIQSVGFLAVFSLVAWSLIYYMRALTEERHLMQDGEYAEYMKKVRYMFIPGVY